MRSEEGHKKREGGEWNGMEEEGEKVLGLIEIMANSGRDLS